MNCVMKRSVENKYSVSTLCFCIRVYKSCICVCVSIRAHISTLPSCFCRNLCTLQIVKCSLFFSQSRLNIYNFLHRQKAIFKLPKFDRYLACNLSTIHMHTEVVKPVKWLSSRSELTINPWWSGPQGSCHQTVNLTVTPGSDLCQEWIHRADVKLLSSHRCQLWEADMGQNHWCKYCPQKKCTVFGDWILTVRSEGREQHRLWFVS